MKKILYACVCNNGGLLRVAEWCQRYSQNHDDVLFLLFTKSHFEETENLKCIDWGEDNTVFSREKIEFFSHEIEKKIDVSQIRCMIGDYLTLSYFERFNIPFFYDVHILAKPMHEMIHKERRMVAMDNDLLSMPLNTLIDVISFDFMKFENKWIRRAEGYFVNSQATLEHLKSYYRDEIKDRPIIHIPLSGIETDDQVASYSQRKFEYDCFTFSRLHPQKGYHFLFYKNWQNHPLFVRGIPHDHLKDSGLQILQENSITLLGWSSKLGLIKEDILKSKVVLFPSIYEPFGLALQEALSYGAICICHKNNSGHEEQVQDGVNGFLVDMANTDWFKDLERILTLPIDQLEVISKRAMAGVVRGDGARDNKFLETIQQETFFLSETE